VWSARMLAALENGVKGGKWFSLIDKVYAMPNLRAAFRKCYLTGVMRWVGAFEVVGPSADRTPVMEGTRVPRALRGAAVDNT